MDSFTLNKWAGAILASCIAVFVMVEVGHFVYHPAQPKVRGYQIEVPEVGSSSVAEKEQIPFATLLAASDAARGEKVSRKCVGCHAFEQGGGAKTGPNLYGVIGASVGAKDYAYSSAMASFGGNWGIDELNAYLTNPKGYMKGTKMSFAGLKKDQQRADLIAYLNTMTSSPVQFPAE